MGRVSVGNDKERGDRKDGENGKEAPNETGDLCKAPLVPLLQL